LPNHIVIYGCEDRVLRLARQVNPAPPACVRKIGGRRHRSRSAVGSQHLGGPPQDLARRREHDAEDGLAVLDQRDGSRVTLARSLLMIPWCRRRIDQPERPPSSFGIVARAISSSSTTDHDPA